MARGRDRAWYEICIQQHVHRPLYTTIVLTLYRHSRKRTAAPRTWCGRSAMPGQDCTVGTPSTCGGAAHAAMQMQQNNGLTFQESANNQFTLLTFQHPSRAGHLAAAAPLRTHKIPASRDITSYGNAGNYEFQSVAAVSGNDIGLMPLASGSF